MSTPREDVGLWMCRAVKLKVTPEKKKMLQYSLEITFHIQHDFKSLGATRKTKNKTYFLKLPIKKKKKIILT